MFVDLYDCMSSEILLKTGRQVSKSTFNSRDILLDMVQFDFFQTLFVCPLKEQTTRFSNNYLGTDIESIPIVKQYYTNTDVTKNVLSRGLLNGSLCQLTYAQQDAERARGIPSDKVTYDEVQDIPMAHLPIINECLSASDFKFRRYTGTPKTLDNTIEQLWVDSTQCEWVITCPACKADNIPNEVHVHKMIGENGPVCHKCGTPLNVRNGRWVIFGDEDADITGFHIPQIIMPIHAEPHSTLGNKPWKEILRKQRNYSEAQFNNEVLGLSYDSGGRLVTISELRDICTGKYYTEYDHSEMVGEPIVAGIDWGISAQTSYTVLTVGSFDSIREVFKVYYVKKFPSTDILEQIDEIVEICKRFKVTAIGADMGVGNTNNMIVEKNYKGHGAVYKYMYTSANFLMEHRPQKGFFVLDKTLSLNLLFMAMKRKKVQFYDEQRFATYFDDILSIFQEMSESPTGLKMYFNHDKTRPDDFVHSLNFAMLTAYKLIDHHYINMTTANDLPPTPSN